MTLLVLYSLCIKYIAQMQMCFFVSSFSLSFSFSSVCQSVICQNSIFLFLRFLFLEEALLFKRTNTNANSFDILIESFLSLCLSLSLLSSSVVCSAVLLLVFCRCSFFKRKDALFLLRSLVNDGVGGIQRER